jgi:tetratricopeptide (TPR) repeat protein
MMFCACGRNSRIVVAAAAATGVIAGLALLDSFWSDGVGESVRLGRAAHAAGDFDRAIGHFDHAVALDPADPAGWEARGDAHYGVNDLEAALADYDSLIALCPDDALAHLRRAKTLLGLRREEEMFAELDRALALDPALSEARRQRAWVHFNEGDYQAALRDLDLMITDESFRGEIPLADVLALRAETRLSIGDEKGAIDDLEVLRASGGDARDVIRTTVWATWGMQRYGDALHILDELLIDSERSANLQLARALTLMHLGRLEDSLGLLEDLRANWRAVPAEADLFLWIAQMRAGKSEKAIDSLPPDEHFTRWHAMIARLLRGEIREAELLATADAAEEDFTRARMQCEAFYYAGMKRLFEGDEVGAIDLLEQCVATQIRRYYEYHAAVAELSRVKSSIDSGD